MKNPISLKRYPRFVLPVTGFMLILLIIYLLINSYSEQQTELALTAIQPKPVTTSVQYSDVKEILQHRCVVCHACYDSPCQANLASMEGIRRGANRKPVYDGTRLIEADPTRLFVDAHSVDEWRNKGFFPIVNENSNSAAGDNLNNSLIYKMLQLKRNNPLPLQPDGRIENDKLDFSLSRSWICPDNNSFAKFASENVHAGMPFGLPGISDQEFSRLSQWLQQGNQGRDAPLQLDAYQNAIKRWESLLNGADLKSQLVARYIYEHLFLAHIYFSEIDHNVYFKLIRSSTPPGAPANRIATRRPYDDPKVKRVYYRLIPLREPAVSKTHIPYAFNAKQMARIKDLFFKPEYTVTKLPSYKADIASNPFKSFAQLPVQSRYRFMLEQAEFTIRGFIKGAVCRGQVALNVIDDHFWVFFTTPNIPSEAVYQEFLQQQADNLSLPARAQSNAEPLINWLELSNDQQKYLKHKSSFLNKNLFATHALDETYVWDGDKINTNATLTVFRHFDSASVRRGLLGQAPQTVWLIDYPVLERIHYLLVAGFDVYGNIGHQLLTRLYMDFLRMESEFNFLALLPDSERIKTRDHWYRNAPDRVNNYIQGEYARLSRAPDIKYQTKNPLPELLQRLHKYLQPALADESDLMASQPPPLWQKIRQIETLQGQAASIIPEMSVILIDTAKPALFTLLRNSAHSNISGLLNEADRRLPGEDNLTVLPGIIGAYPDALWHIEADKLDQFIADITMIKNEDDYRQVMAKYGVRRSSPEFWKFSDRLHQVYQSEYPVAYGSLDYNRLENR
jgi:hypothetical protein